MKKVFKYASFLLIGGAITVTSCSKKSDDPVTPTTNEPTCDGGSVKTKNVLIDYSTSGGSGYERAYSQSVTKCDGSAIIYLDIKSQTDMDKIYITLSQDNGQATPFYAPAAKGFAGAVSASTTPEDKNFTAGSASNGYSLDIPDPGAGNAKYIKVPVTVPVRNSDAATTDVYTIWITNGKGDFTTYTKGNVVIGPITVTLKYKSVNNTFTTFSGLVGDQRNANPSYISTIGNGGTISGTKIKTDADSAEVFKSIDINFVGLDAAGTGLGSIPSLLSPDQRDEVGFKVNTYSTNRTTKYGEFTGSFDGLTADAIAGLSAPSADHITVVNNKAYTFLTQDGKKGVIQITNLTTSGSGSSQANFSVKVLN